MPNIILITGATSGIGLGFARHYLQQGDIVHVVGRNQVVLTQLKQQFSNCQTHHCDFSDQRQLTQFCQDIAEITFDIVINNAGFGDFGPFIESSLSKNIAMVKVNCIALMMIAHVTLKNMVKRQKGYLLNVASAAGFSGGPNLAVYYATKNFVVSLSEALHTELKDDNVHVSALCPGPIHTQFGKRANYNQSIIGNELIVQSVPEVVSYTIKAMRKAPVLMFPSLLFKILIILMKFIPRKMVQEILKTVQKRRQAASQPSLGE